MAAVNHLSPASSQHVDDVLKSNRAHFKAPRAGELHHRAMRRIEHMLHRAEALLRRLFWSRSRPRAGPRPDLKDIRFNEEDETTFEAVPTTLGYTEQSIIVILNMVLRGLDCSNGLFDPALEPVFGNSDGLCFEDMDRVESRSFFSTAHINSRLTLAKLRGFDDEKRIPFCERSFDFLRPDTHKIKEETGRAEISIAVNVYYQRLTIDLENMTLSEGFLFAIDEALDYGETREQKYDALTDVFNRFGHVVCTKMYLGGKIFSHATHIVVKRGEEENAKKEFVAWSASSEDSAQINQAFGGDNRLYETPARWLATTRVFHTWRVIEYIDLIPTYMLLDEERREKVAEILRVFQPFL